MRANFSFQKYETSQNLPHLYFWSYWGDFKKLSCQAKSLAVWIQISKWNIKDDFEEKYLQNAFKDHKKLFRAVFLGTVNFSPAIVDSAFKLWRLKYDESDSLVNDKIW